MDRRQLVAQRVREYFGERLDDVVEMVRQDRQDIRNWQEPAYVRDMMRTLRRRENADSGSTTPGDGDRTTITERSATERSAFDLELGTFQNDTPLDDNQATRRERTALLLDQGSAGLQKVTRGSANDLTAQETLGLECVLILYGRPAVQINPDGLAGVSPLWNTLEDLRDEVELTQRGVGRIELLGHPEYDWAGTGFLVSDEILMTTRRVADLFIEPRDGGLQFRPGISAWMNYRPGYQGLASAGYRIRQVVGVHDRYDLALLEVERPQSNGSSPVPLALASEPPPQREGRPVYLVGYPVRDARRNEPEAISRLFQDIYNVKRIQPGQLCGELTFHELTLLRHDAAPLGQNAGAPLVDLEMQQVIGLQSTSRFLEASTAVPLYLLRDDPLLRSAGVHFAEATRRDRQTVVEQLDRLARSRFWNETRSAISDLYRRAFGYDTGRGSA